MLRTGAASPIQVPAVRPLNGDLRSRQQAPSWPSAIENRTGIPFPDPAAARGHHRGPSSSARAVPCAAPGAPPCPGTGRFPRVAAARDSQGFSSRCWGGVPMSRAPQDQLRIRRDGGSSLGARPAGHLAWPRPRERSYLGPN
ncbi:hypothetical protein NDU88_001701 [Pleurodeles waltl]|uniref:Uncharacterized protein n=1 Tax=Pleurodeles waltl TaxID=8319 RepID=A0AAV7T0Y7_PLEWA|nr:hypothetical protein NDU88_001701 [Pleurodeles waltl]